jgi:hypothetical protein
MATKGTARQAGSGHCGVALATRGTVRPGDEERQGPAGKATSGATRRGRTRRGRDWHGRQGVSRAAWSGLQSLGWAASGQARFGRHGSAGQQMARPGRAGQRHARLGRSWQGLARKAGLSRRVRARCGRNRRALVRRGSLLAWQASRGSVGQQAGGTAPSDVAGHGLAGAACCGSGRDAARRGMARQANGMAARMPPFQQQTKRG